MLGGPLKIVGKIWNFYCVIILIQRNFLAGETEKICTLHIWWDTLTVSFPLSPQNFLTSLLCYASFNLPFLPHDAMHKHGYSRHAVSVCTSVCLSRSWIISKRINISSKFFTIGSHTILVFPCQMGWRYSHGNPSNGGVECRYKSRFWSNSWLSKIAGHAKCQKHLPTTKLSIWHSRPRTTGYRSIAGRANYDVTKTATDDHAV